MKSIRERLNEACPVLSALALGDYLKEARDIFNGSINGLRKSVTFAEDGPDLAIGNIAYCLSGRIGFKRETTKSFTETTHNVAAGKFAAFRIKMDIDENILIDKGADQDTEELALANIPEVGSTHLDLGYLVIEGVWTAGTSGLDGDNIDFYPVTTCVLDDFSGLDE